MKLFFSLFLSTLKEKNDVFPDSMTSVSFLNSEMKKMTFLFFFSSIHLSFKFLKDHRFFFFFQSKKEKKSPKKEKNTDDSQLFRERKLFHTKKLHIQAKFLEKRTKRIEQMFFFLLFFFSFSPIR